MHTPGPWTYRLIPPDSIDPYRKHWVDAANGSPIADIFNTGEHAVADAKLIAAAPKLLYACELARSLIRGEINLIDAENNLVLPTLEDAIMDATL